jgi:hypothetical protein
MWKIFSCGHGVYFIKDHVVQWIHIEKLSTLIVTFDGKGRFTSQVVSKWDGDLIEQNAELIVVDGATKQNYAPLSDVLAWWMQKNKRFMVVGFLQMNLVKGEDFINWQSEEIVCNGWKWEEYVTACIDQTTHQPTSFEKSIDSMLDTSDLTTDFMERLEEKYFIAGACARWMFFMNTKKALQDIGNQLQSVTNAANLLSGLDGNRSEDAVNHLVTLYGKNSMLVSQYVARELAKKPWLDFVKHATIQSRSLGIGAFDGWIFQMDFLFHLRKAPSEMKQIKVRTSQGDVTWSVTSIVEFYNVNELESLTFQDGCWIIPTKVTQGAYDVAQLSGNPLSKLRVVQLTVAKKHGLKMAYVQMLIEALEKAHITIHALEVIIVVPIGHATVFELGPVEGGGAQRFTNIGWYPDQIEIKEFPRSTQF